MRRIFTLSILVFLTAFTSFGQINYDYFYRPARLELETEVSYRCKNDFIIGLRYNEERFALDPGESKILTYMFWEFPLADGLWLECSYGYGYIHDMEILLVHRTRDLEVCFGCSASDRLVLEFKALLFREKRHRRYL